jgi:PTS system mannose-specific IIA component
MTDPGKLAVVVAHGELARGLVSAMESVLGPQPNVRWLSNTGKTPAALLADLETLVRAEGAGRDVYLLSDLKGGSCALACLRTARTSGVRAVLHGANLTLLLEFVMLQHLPAKPFLAALLEKTRASVGAVELAGGEGGRETTAAERSAPDTDGASAESPEPARHGST